MDTKLLVSLKCVLTLVLSLNVGGASAGGPANPSAMLGNQADPDGTERLIVRYATGKGAQRTSDSMNLASRAVQEEANRKGFIARKLRTTGSGAEVWIMDRRMSGAEARDLAHRIATSDPSVLYAEPDALMQPLFTPNDPFYNNQWHYFEPVAGINLPDAWDRATGGGVRIAVVDTGLVPHSDLSGNILPGYDFISDSLMANDGNGRDSNPSDPGDGVAPGECAAIPGGRSSSWHGTHVAGTIAARTNNQLGVAGIAYGASIVPVRVLGKCGGYLSDIADGIIWAAGGSVAGVINNANPAQIINLSLGGSGACGNVYTESIRIARGLGALIVAAAGNNGSDVSSVRPANCPGVLAVAALNRSGARASFSNYGSAVSLAAPGESVLSTLNTGTGGPGADTYAYYSGTSMAAPHVAGVAALLWSQDPLYTAEGVQSVLQATARPFPGICVGCGGGIVNAAAAVAPKASTTTTVTFPVVPVEYNPIWYYHLRNYPVTTQVGGDNATGSVTFKIYGGLSSFVGLVPLAVATIPLQSGSASIMLDNYVTISGNGGQLSVITTYSGDAHNRPSKSLPLDFDYYGD